MSEKEERRLNDIELGKVAGGANADEAAQIAEEVENAMMQFAFIKENIVQAGDAGELKTVRLIEELLNDALDGLREKQDVTGAGIALGTAARYCEKANRYNVKKFGDTVRAIMNRITY